MIVLSGATPTGRLVIPGLSRIARPSVPVPNTRTIEPIVISVDGKTVSGVAVGITAVAMSWAVGTGVGVSVVTGCKAEVVSVGSGGWVPSGTTTGTVSTGISPSEEVADLLLFHIQKPKIMSNTTTSTAAMIKGSFDERLFAGGSFGGGGVYAGVICVSAIGSSVEIGAAIGITASGEP